jgi:hypothetical protein
MGAAAVAAKEWLVSKAEMSGNECGVERGRATRNDCGGLSVRRGVGREGAAGRELWSTARRMGTANLAQPCILGRPRWSCHAALAALHHWTTKRGDCTAWLRR